MLTGKNALQIKDHTLTSNIARVIIPPALPFVKRFEQQFSRKDNALKRPESLDGSGRLAKGLILPDDKGANLLGVHAERQLILTQLLALRFVHAAVVDYALNRELRIACFT